MFKKHFLIIWFQHSDTSIYDFVEKEFREHYENLPEEDIDWSTVPGGLDATPGILSQYVDDFVNLYKPGSNAENALNESLKLKPDEDHSLKRLLDKIGKMFMNLKKMVSQFSVQIRPNILSN